jgi:NAD(P)H-dependent flavin oxidoreductase YrpB (nitropropane dioxygenase family)
MKPRVCELFGIDVPIFAFSHCRDVVAAASRSGGMGVLGVEMFSPEELRRELEWIERHVDGRPYGIDALFPGKFMEIKEKKEQSPDAVIPSQHRQFVEDLLQRHGVPHLPAGEEDAMVRERIRNARGTPEYSAALVEEALRFPGLRLLVSAIGTLPRELIEKAHAAGVKVGGMVGAVEHAVRQRDAGVDIVIAQGYEAGGHTGEIATMVLTPQVVDAMNGIPVLAAGGIATGRQMAAALALGADGVWCGSVWLTTQESDLPVETKRKLLSATSSETIRTRSYTGKPARFLKSAWSDAWAAEEAPPPLMRPLQHLLSRPATRRIERARSEALMSTPVGQVVGQMGHERTVKQVYESMLTEFVDARERINALVGN